MNTGIDSNKYEKSDQSFLKQYNVKKILNILKTNKSMSRIELSVLSSLDKKTITNITKELLDQNKLKVLEHRSEGMGRPKEMLGLNGDYCYNIGIDLGGVYIAGIILDFAGNIICSHSLDLYNDMDPETLVKVSYNLIDNLLKKSSLKIDDIHGIGVSVPGFIDKDTGASVLAENMPQWFNVPLKKMFQEKYNIEVFVEDCSRLMAVAELWYGEGRDINDFLAIDLGLGIGCGIIIDQKVFSGASGKSGEIGHTKVEVNGPLCTCGRQGCIESLASGWALTKQASEALKEGQDTLLREMNSSSGNGPATKDIILAAELGDEYSIKLLKRAGQYIGIGIANAIGMFNPLKVIINGRLIHENDLLLTVINETIKEETMTQIYNDTQIVKSKIGFFSSSMGAATLCLRKYY